MKLDASLVSALLGNIAPSRPTASIVQAESIQTQWETLIVIFVNKVAIALTEVQLALLVMLENRPLQPSMSALTAPPERGVEEALRSVKVVFLDVIR